MDENKHASEDPAVGQPPVFEPAEAAHVLRMTPQQHKFAEGLRMGMNKTAAAAHAGCPGEGSALRARGSTLGKNAKVKAYLAWAERGGAGLPDDPVGVDELRKILAQHARAGDRATSLRACEVIHRLKQADTESAASRTVPFDPTAMLDQMCELGPVGVVIALANAKRFRADAEVARWSPPPSAAAAAVAALSEALNLKMTSLGLTEISHALTDAKPVPADTSDQTPADRQRAAFHEANQRALPMWQSNS
jgi:hypothetical protein